MGDKTDFETPTRASGFGNLTTYCVKNFVHASTALTCSVTIALCHSMLCGTWRSLIL